MAVIFVFAAIRETLNENLVPEAFKGNALALIIAAIMAMILTGFGGVL